ncbi:MAG: hypothetical protein ACXWIO_11540 [Croceibacterium sp.]
MGRLNAALAVLLGCVALLASVPARAADEEIQVYMYELNPAGGVGLDVHVNDVLEGDPIPPYSGAEPALHRWRVTPEFSLGLGGGFELGAYLPLATIGHDGVVRIEGAKARLKWLAPHGERGFYWGANFEIGKVAHRVDENPWNGEFKLIGGWRDERWTLAANVNVDFVVSGPGSAPALVEIATKAGYKVAPNLTLGLESYNGVGTFSSFGHFNRNDHATFLTADFALGRWDFDAGIGKGYGANADGTILKFVIGVPIG